MDTPPVPTWDHEYDFIIVGSGAGGLTAALTLAELGLRPLVVEKAATFGGSTGISGGGIWIPNNPELRRHGHDDSRDSILTYLAQLTEGRVPQARLEAYVDHGPDAMALLERSRWMRFRWVVGYSDYHPELEGGRPRGRSVEPRPFDTRMLGEDEASLYTNTMRGPLGLWLTQRDYHHLAMAKRTWRGRLQTLVAAWRVTSNLVRRRHMATNGRALVARLRMALKGAGVPLWLSTPMVRLVVEGDRVTGLVVNKDGQERRVRGVRGVLLATGGFEHNEDMRQQHLPHGGQPDFSGGAPENTGDGIRAGQEVGAAVDLMDDAWWMPSVISPAGAVVCLVSERAIPSQVIVCGDGKRFTNEASPYVNFVHDQLAGKHDDVWMIMDSRTRSRYPFAHILPGLDFPSGYYANGTVRRADSLAALAEAIDVPADALVSTIDRFNGFARNGEDADFGRGESAYDRYYGDPTLKNPNLDVIDTAPYYAVRITIGDLGTKGGLICDEQSRVLRADGSVIQGLYATGNTSASVMGNEYAGPGATIGPSLTFGFIAAKHAAEGSEERSRRE